LGLASYFRRFIKDFALKARPLYSLLKKGVSFDFGETCKESFTLLKRELTSAPVLALYNPAVETELHTDASSAGLGAILLQKQPSGLWAVVAFYSQATNQAEARYHSFELEMLAIVRAVERFHLYLYGLNFTIVTDCNALVYAINKANLNPRIARWTLALQNYTFNVVHRPGERMRHVDALSRCVAYVNELPLERELEFRQLADPRIQEISRDLELKDSDRFTLADIDTALDTERVRARDSASTATELIRAYNKKYRDDHFKKPSVYSNGDYVMVRDMRAKPGVNSKLVVRDIPGFNISARPYDTVLSADKLKLWIKPVIPAK